MLDKIFGRAARARRRRFAGSGRILRPAVFALAGLVAIALSLLPGDGLDDAWVRDLLMGIGGSLALFAPLYFMTRSLDGHLDRVEVETRETVAEVRQEAAAATDEVRSNLETLRTDVDQRLSDFSRQVVSALEAEAEADAAAWESLRSDTPTFDRVHNALERAVDLGLLVDDYPPRVAIGDGSGLYVSVTLNVDDDFAAPLVFVVGWTNGQTVDEVEWWDSDETAIEVFRRVGRVLRRENLATFDPAPFLKGLADLFEAAASMPDRHAAIELCDPQWMVCERRIVASGRDGRKAPYSLSVEDVRPGRDLGFMFAKTWVDGDSFDRARAVALALFPPQEAWGTASDPPF